ncbi:MAG TPA: DUF397 domain-containing protein [Streptosporangiaceae bacterium]
MRSARSVADSGEYLPGLPSTSWRTSSWSGYNGNCIQAARFTDRWIGVRDSKQNDAGSVLVFDQATWARFLAGVRNGDFVR